MTRLSELVGLPDKPRLVIQEYHKTLEDWCNEMNLNQDLRKIVMNSQLVLIPDGYRDCPKTFTNYTSDFYNYCKRIDGLNIEICCNDEDFTEMELCSSKVRLGRVMVSVFSTIVLNVISGYIKDAIDSNIKNEPEVEQVSEAPSFQSEPECSFSIIVKDTTGKYIEIRYDGPVSGMDEAGDQIKKIAGDGE